MFGGGGEWRWRRRYIGMQNDTAIYHRCWLSHITTTTTTKKVNFAKRLGAFKGFVCIHRENEIGQ